VTRDDSHLHVVDTHGGDVSPGRRSDTHASPQGPVAEGNRPPSASLAPAQQAQHATTPGANLTQPQNLLQQILFESALSAGTGAVVGALASPKKRGQGAFYGASANLGVANLMSAILDSQATSQARLARGVLGVVGLGSTVYFSVYQNRRSVSPRGTLRGRRFRK